MNLLLVTIRLIYSTFRTSYHCIYKFTVIISYQDVLENPYISYHCI